MVEHQVVPVLVAGGLSMLLASIVGAIVVRHLIRRFSTDTYEGTVLSYTVEKYEYEHGNLVAVTGILAFLVVWLGGMAVSAYLLQWLGFF